MLDAAKAMKLSAKDLLELQIIDEIVEEPSGGAHRDRDLILQNVKKIISKNLDNFKNMSAEEIFSDRKNKFLRIGRNKGFISNLENLSSLKSVENNFNQIWKSKKFFLPILALAVLALLVFIN